MLISCLCITHMFKIKPLCTNYENRDICAKKTCPKAVSDRGRYKFQNGYSVRNDPKSEYHTKYMNSGHVNFVD